VLDKIGKEIKPGVIVAYGHALGRCAAIQIGLVLEVREGEPFGKYQTATKDAARIKVRGFNRGERWSSWEEDKKWKPLNKDSYLWFPDRCIVLTEIPDAELRKALHEDL
jgi:hypothetical protein